VAESPASGDDRPGMPATRPRGSGDQETNWMNYQSDSKTLSPILAKRTGWPNPMSRQNLIPKILKSFIPAINKPAAGSAKTVQMGAFEHAQPEARFGAKPECCSESIEYARSNLSHQQIGGNPAKAAWL
jgi:hypothetical protein